MGTLNAFYIRANNNVSLPVIQAKFPHAAIEAGPQFIGVTLSVDDYEAPEDTLVGLSSCFQSDVIWLSFQSVVDAFQYHHWQSGLHLRALVYGCFTEERTWERIQGQAEPWEQAVLFDPRNLQRELKYLEDEAEKAELERKWHAGELSEGDILPSLDARECAWKVAEYYRLPGWGI